MRIQIRRDTALNWYNANPVLYSGEFGYETDTKKLKIGTGSNWNSIDYFVYEDTKLTNLNDVTITSPANGDFLRYNGSASVWINDPINLATDTVGDYVSHLVQGTGLTIINNSGEGSTPTIGVTPNTYDAYGSASIVASDLIGEVETIYETIDLLTTTDIAESGNLYFTSQRAIDATVLSYDGVGSASVAEISAVNQANSYTDGRFSAVTLDDISNVSASTPSSGDFLKWNGTAWVNDAINLGTDTTGNYMSDLTQGTGVTITHTPGEGSNATIAIGQAVATSSSVTFAAVTAPLTGNVTGNADTATALDNARTISLTGDVSGSVSFDGTSDVAISATIQPNSVALGTDTTGNYMSGVSVQNGLTVSHTPAEGSSATIGVDNALLSNYLLDGASGNSYGLIGTSEYLDVKNTNGYNKEIELDIAAVETKLNTDGYITESSSSTLSNKTLSSPTLTGTVTFPDNTLALGTKTTGDYVSTITAGTGVTVTGGTGETSTPTVAIGQDVATSASVVFHQLETTGSLIVGQNIYVSGSVVTENQVSLVIDDPFIYLASSGSVANTDFGIAGNYNDGTYHHSGVFRDATDGKWKFFDSYVPEPVHPIDTSDASYSPAPVVADFFESLVANGTAPLTVSSSTVVTNLNADLLDGQHGSYYAPLDSPTFTGTVSLPNNTVALGTQTTGNYVSDVSGGAGVTVTHTPGEGTTPSIAIGQDVATSASVTFANVTAPLTGNVTGNASTATTLATSRTIELTGDVTGSASFNGSSNATITATIAANSVALGTDTTGNYMLDVSAGTGLTVSHTQSEGSTATVSLDATLDNLSNVTAPSPSDGQFLKYVSASTSWVPAAIPTINALDDIGNVNAPSPSDGEFLKYVSASTAWVPAAIPTINALDDIGDVSASTPSSGQFLKWNGTAWVADSIPTINALDDIGNVSAASPTTGEVLAWNGTAWADSTVVRDNLIRFYMEVM
jgi:hypothetical protein